MLNHFLSTFKIPGLDLKRGLVQVLVSILDGILALSPKYRQCYFAITAVAAMASVFAY